MVTIDSLECPNCGAPVPRVPAQTLAACVYCNSTLRIDPAAGGGVQRANEVLPEVIDEVKRKLLLAQHYPAVQYYAQQAQVSEAAAETAVKAIERNMAYYPPLAPAGLVLLVALEFVNAALLLGGGWLAWQGRWLPGVLLILLGAFLALGNTLVIMRGLPGLRLERRGVAARAEIRKRWVISQQRIRGEPAELTRLLVAVRPPGQPPYTAEANCFVSEKSRPKFEPGRIIQVKYDPADRRRLVVTGALDNG
jgi:hypothetical protein